MTEHDHKAQVDQAIIELGEVGFTILRGFIDQSRVEDLGRLCDETFTPVRIPTENINNHAAEEYDSSKSARESLLGQTREVDDLVTDQRLLSIAEAILLEGPPYYRRVRTAGAGFKDAQAVGDDVRALHRDGAIYPVRIPGKPLVMNTLLAIDEFKPESGATTFVPGSHRWDRPVEPDHPAVAIEMDPGDIAVFGGEVWHGHGQNRTSHRRRCLAMLYVCGWLQPFNNFAALFSAEQPDGLPDKLVELI